jgi:hypothetical protein
VISRSGVGRTGIKMRWMVKNRNLPLGYFDSKEIAVLGACENVVGICGLFG